MANIGGREAGTITAACFLSRFTKNLTLGAPGHRRHRLEAAARTRAPPAARCSLLMQYLLDRASRNNPADVTEIPSTPMPTTPSTSPAASPPRPTARAGR